MQNIEDKASECDAWNLNSVCECKDDINPILERK